MYIERRFCCHDVPKTLLDCLDSHKIPYRSDESTTIFYIREDAPFFDEVSELASGFASTVLRNLKFTKKEMQEASWFQMSSKCGKVETIDYDFTFSKSCTRTVMYRDIELEFARHLHQVAPYRVQRLVKWKQKNNFYGDACGGHYKIFCSDVARGILEEKTNGVSFMPVLKGKTENHLPDIQQLVFPNKLPHEALILLKETTVELCPQCGEPRYKPPNTGYFYMGVKEEYLRQDIDFYITETYFGDGQGYPVIVVSRKVYELFTKEFPERNLVFVPVFVE